MNNTAVLEKSYKILSYMDDENARARSACMELIDATLPLKKGEGKKKTFWRRFYRD